MGGIVGASAISRPVGTANQESTVDDHFKCPRMHKKSNWQVTLLSGHPSIPSPGIMLLNFRCGSRSIDSGMEITMS